MSYLRIDKTLIANLDESLQREYIRSNQMGAYASSTIVECNTRKQHGMLVVPSSGVSGDNHVLLSSLDPTIIQHKAEFNLGIHQYPDKVFSPNGHKYILEYDVDIVPSTTYRVGGVLLKKEWLFSHREHRVLVKYTLLNAHSPTTIRFRPFLAFRHVSELTYENDQIDRSYRNLAGGISMRLYPGYPELYMQFSAENIFHSEDNWYKDILYQRDQELGLPCTEDLYVPGYFEMPITKDEPIYFSAALREVDEKQIRNDYDEMYQLRRPRDSFRASLVNAAKQFIFRPNEKDRYIIAGFPWFGVRARDMLISLPGCSLYADAPESFDQVMDTLMPLLLLYISQESTSASITGLHDPDIEVWAIWAIQQYAHAKGIEQARKRYGQFVKTVIEYYLSNRHPNARLQESGLLYILGDGRPLTWMNAKDAEGRTIINRYGYTVELNALWYNALCFHREINQLESDDELSKLISRTKRSFVNVFTNEHGYLYDFVTIEGRRDLSVRPNMIFSISLPYSPLGYNQRRSILDIITRELHTPKGIRSLSPNSEGYRPNCSGDIESRSHAYYNGSAWPWLLGPYLEAYLRLHKHGGRSYVMRLLISMENELRYHGISTISELYDGAPPHYSRGAISFSMSVGEILRILALIEKEEKEETKTSIPFDYRL